MLMARNEYPRPQFVRDRWMNLNGIWQFELDLTGSGLARGLHLQKRLAGEINVPFCPESELSGVRFTDFIAGCLYKRSFDLPEDWLHGRVLLHFGAVNYTCIVWINGKEAGSHQGGYSSFTLDITAYVCTGENTITVYARSDVRSPLQPSGKQSMEYESRGCFYTRTTGIWQTVWLEPVAPVYLADPSLTPDIENARLHFSVKIPGNADPLRVRLRASYQGKFVGETLVHTSTSSVQGSIQLCALYLWEVGQGRLYDLDIALLDGETVLDAVQSYFGMRSISIAEGNVLFNKKPLYQRLVLDQGFYPQGVITAPDDAALRGDIVRSMALGFNGARMHQKIFEARYIYWADRMGYLLWGEYPNWGLNIEDGNGLLAFVDEWREILRRDVSSPSIIGWCPFNETSLNTSLPLLQTVYRLTKTLDPSRLAIDTSGWVHCDETDLFDYHDYEQDPSVFLSHVQQYAISQPGKPFAQIRGLFPYLHRAGRDVISKGQPVFISEFGGIGWNAQSAQANAWGYGTRPKTQEEFLARLDGLINAVLSTPGICGFCYTQLTDVEQEINGLYTYAREPKFDPAKVRALLSRSAWCE